MKKILTYISFCFIASAFVACEKDEVKTVLENTTSGTLSVNKTSLTLTEADVDNTAATFTWTDGFTYSAKVATNKSYAVQIDRAGNNFKNARELSSGVVFKKEITVGDLNTELVKGLKSLSFPTTSFEVRVACTISGFAPIYSNVIPVTINSYRELAAGLPSVYVPGNYQGWMPDKAPSLASINDDGIYEGYINFPVATAFKITPMPNWSRDFGDEEATGDSGKLKVKGTDMKAKTPGYYFITVDTVALKWTAEATTWAVVGNASGGWDADKDLKYDAATNAWSATLPLKKGGMKFRANKKNKIMYGDAEGDGTLETDGNDIEVDVEGTYTVTLLLGKPGKYSYTAKKN